MRRSLARRAMALTSASVGLRKVSRSVSRTQGLASRNLGVGMSCNISGSCDAARHCAQNKHEIKRGGRFPASPLEPLRLRRFNRTRRTHVVHRLFGRLRDRKYRYEGAAVGFCPKLDTPFDLGKQSMIGAHADIKARMPGGAALTRDNVAGNHVFAAVRLDPEPLAR